MFKMSGESQRSNYRVKTTMPARTFCGTSTDSPMFVFSSLRFLKIAALLWITIIDRSSTHLAQSITRNGYVDIKNYGITTRSGRPRLYRFNRCENNEIHMSNGKSVCNRIYHLIKYYSVAISEYRRENGRYTICYRHHCHVVDKPERINGGVAIFTRTTTIRAERVRYVNLRYSSSLSRLDETHISVQIGKK